MNTKAMWDIITDLTTENNSKVDLINYLQERVERLKRDLVAEAKSHRATKQVLTRTDEQVDDLKGKLNTALDIAGLFEHRAQVAEGELALFKLAHGIKDN